jgi:hypothetical protein
LRFACDLPEVTLGADRVPVASPKMIALGLLGPGAFAASLALCTYLLATS